MSRVCSKTGARHHLQWQLEKVDYTMQLITLD